MGRALAKSAASSSLASGFTTDQYRGKGNELCETQLATTCKLEQREQGRQHLPRLRARRTDIAPSGRGAQREDSTHGIDRAIDIQRTSDDVMDERFASDPQ